MLNQKTFFLKWKDSFLKAIWELRKEQVFSHSDHSAWKTHSTPAGVFKHCSVCLSGLTCPPMAWGFGCLSNQWQMVGGAVGIESLSHWAFEFLASTVSHSISQKNHSLYFLVTTFLDESECFLPGDIGQFLLLCDSNVQATSSHDLQSHFLPHFTPLLPHAAKFSLKWQTQPEDFQWGVIMFRTQVFTSMAKKREREKDSYFLKKMCGF